MRESGLPPPARATKTAESDTGAKAGDVMYFDAVEHLPENLGDQAFEVIAVELKK